ncbi:hypothetical protein LSCM1_00234 [Leishmania martiniquensis]|uniref:Guanylate kinase-like domain-containing protein n=1 Tax=Leishmania martiniquensis TaxID=1580590 RepID=A0A836G0T2_9TRYP|nr:hypothetical protein LSCM1_00234 [Leishmania martiniquensis]
MSASTKTSMPVISTVTAASAAHNVAQRAIEPLRDTVSLRHLVDVLLFVGPSGCGKSTMIHRLQRDWPTLFEFSVSHTTRRPRRGEVPGQHYHFVTMEEFQQLIDAGSMIEYSHLGFHKASPSSPHSRPVGDLYGTSKKAVDTVLERNRVVLMDTDLLGAISIRRYCAGEVVKMRPVAPSKTGQPAAQQDSSTASPEQDPLALSPSQPAPLPLDRKRAVVPACAARSKDAALSPTWCLGPRAKRPLRCMVIFIAPPSMEVLEQRLRERKSETEASLQLRMRLSRLWLQWAKENMSLFDYFIVNDDLELCYAKLKHIVQSEVLMVESSL